MGGHIHCFVFEASFFASDYVGIRFLFADVLYESRWPNPLWGLAYDVAAEWHAIAAHLHELIKLHARCPWGWEPLAITDAVEDHESQVTWWRRLAATWEIMRRR